MMASLHQRFAALIPELAKFGIVGGIGAVVDLGGAAYLHVAMGIGPMVAKGLSISAATVITYLGSRFWTFRHRVNQALLREGVLFVMLNIIGLLIAEAVIAFTSYGLGMKGALTYNAASLAGTGLGTIFRYFSYKKWVFLAGTPEVALVPVPVAAVRAGGRHAARHASGSRPGGQRHPVPGPARHAAPQRPAPATVQAYPSPVDYPSRYDHPSRSGHPARYGPFREHLDPAAAAEPF
jgi:putative flippase GtrA